MFWRVPRKQFDAGKGDGNKRALKKIVTAGRKPGIIGYAGSEPVGWCAVAPREVYVGLENSRLLKPVDDRPVWSISCLFIRKRYRRRGMSVKLLRAAVAFAAQQGATVVEGYPTEPSMDQMPDPFLWHGVPSSFRSAGSKKCCGDRKAGQSCVTRSSRQRVALLPRINRLSRRPLVWFPPGA